MPAKLQTILAIAARRRLALVAAVLLLAIGGIAAVPLLNTQRRPPNIFDTPVDGVLDFLADSDFNRMSIEDRVAFITGLIERFQQMSQIESAAAAAFLAGLTGPANEQLVDNMRVLGRDILLQGAQQYLAIQTDEDRQAFLDQWIVRWVRLTQDISGSPIQRSDEDILSRLQRDAWRDLERQGADMDAQRAQQMIEFWERDIASVTSPREQAMLYQFLPALRQHILMRGK